jgi:hypothetical protein
MNLDTILGERLAILGGTGSGKSYAARGLAERILARGDRLGVIDPTGVWWGLRSEFPVVLFGGDHADLPLTEHAGRVVAQAVATSQQSWIIDTSALHTKAAERRFMLDFLDGLFGANRAPITLIVDEADRFSPQRMSPETTRLHERMEEIVRRGRVRGFTPWLITQRPASLNKDVLSQATALICMRMTGAQDRSAIGDVIEGQADKATAKAIIDAMPRHKVGEGMVWAPMQDILLPAKFPKIKTFDSMSADTAHKHADRKLPPIDVDSLKEKLASVEVETKANDPTALKKRIRELEAEVARKPTSAIDAAALDRAQKEAHADGRRQGFAEAVAAAAARLKVIAGDIERAQHALGLAAQAVAGPLPTDPQGVAAPTSGIVRRQEPYRPAPATPVVTRDVRPAEGISRPQQRILDALAWLEWVGSTGVDRIRVAMLADQSPKSSGFRANLSTLSGAGLLTYRGGDGIDLTEVGRQAANKPSGAPTNAELHQAIRSKISGPQWKMLAVLIEAYPSAMGREALARASDQSPTSSGFRANLSTLSGLGFVDYQRDGNVAATGILFVEE